MKKDLKKFIENNRQSFDDQETPNDLMHKILLQLTSVETVKAETNKKKGVVIYKWYTAAAVALIVSAAFFYVNNNKQNEQPIMVKTENSNLSEVLNNKIETESPIDATKKEPIKTEKEISKPTKLNEPKQEKEEKTETVKEEYIAFDQARNGMTKLISMRHAELKQLANTNPELYSQFKNDFRALNNNYNMLTSKFKSTNNKEGLIEALIYNLQMQIEILNKQLTIIKQLNIKNKKNDYENSI